MENGFKDHFSGVSTAYAAARPTYPPTLFDWLAGLPGGRDVAVDCACGNGQATLDLALRFDRVIGIEASEAQLRSAPRRSNIVWQVARAENTGLPDGSTDLITVAQSAHWFELDAFYRETRRLLRPGGVVALWCYGLNTVEGETITRRLNVFYEEEVGTYWPPERRHVEAGYRTLDFPFREIEAPAFEMSCQWTLAELLAYLGTWSAVSRFREATRRDPLTGLEADLRPLWGGARVSRRVTWPLALRAGRI